MTGIRLDGKAAIVTGGAQGMGHAMAAALAEAGAGVVIADVEAATLEAALAALGGDRVKGIAADVTREDDCMRVATACRDAFGRIDLLVNNAGIGMATIKPDYPVDPILLWEVRADQLLGFLAVHAVAPIRMAAAVLPAMRAQGRGRIVTVTTSLDTMLRPHYAPYGGAKAASEAFTAALAAELDGTGVTVNVLIPGGAVDTRMVPDRPGMDRATLTRPEVMGPPVVWLASEQSDGFTACRFMAPKDWDETASPTEQMTRAAAPIGWGPHAG